MNVAQLRYFVAVAQLEHYSKAAKALYITQPALSNSMNRLEKELGVQLFESMGRNIVLTPQGKDLLVSVSAALKELDRGFEAIRDHGNNQKKTARIGAVASILRDPLSSFLNIYNSDSEYKLTFELSQQETTKESIIRLKNGTFDFAFCGYPVSEPDIGWIPLFYQSAIAVVESSHPLAKHDTISLNDIKDYPQLSYRQPTYMYYAFEDFFKEVGLNPKEAFEDEISALSVMAVNKDCVGITLDTARDVLWDSIKMIPIRELDMPYHCVGMSYRKSTVYSENLRAFIDFITQISNTYHHLEPIERKYYN